MEAVVIPRNAIHADNKRDPISITVQRNIIVSIDEIVAEKSIETGDANRSMVIEEALAEYIGRHKGNSRESIEERIRDHQAKIQLYNERLQEAQEDLKVLDEADAVVLQQQELAEAELRAQAEEEAQYERDLIIGREKFRLMLSEAAGYKEQVHDAAKRMFESGHGPADVEIERRKIFLDLLKKGLILEGMDENDAIINDLRAAYDVWHEEYKQIQEKYDHPKFDKCKMLIVDDHVVVKWNNTTYTL